MDRLPYMSFEIPITGLVETERLDSFFHRSGFVTVPTKKKIPLFTEENARAQIKSLWESAQTESRTKKKTKLSLPGTRCSARHVYPEKDKAKIVVSKPRNPANEYLCESPVFYYRGPHLDQHQCVNEDQINKALAAEGLVFQEDALFDNNRIQYTFDHLMKKLQQPPEFMCNVYEILQENVPRVCRFQYEDKMTLENMKRFVVLKSQHNAKRQGVHIDQVEEGLVAMASADGQPFKIGVCPGSHRIVKRIKELRETWLVMRRQNIIQRTMNYEVGFFHVYKRLLI